MRQLIYATFNKTCTSIALNYKTRTIPIEEICCIFAENSWAFVCFYSCGHKQICLKIMLTRQ